jgi:hypothetical protein
MPLPTTFAGDSSRGEGQWTGSYGVAPIGGPYYMAFSQDTMVSYTTASNGSPNDQSTFVQVDTSGNVYEGINFNNPYHGSFATATSIRKRNSSGTILWEYQFYGNSLPPGSSGLTTLNAMVVDSSSNVIITVSDLSQSYLLQLNSSGSVQWQTQITSGFASSLAVDSSGNIYAAVGSGSTAAYIMKFNSSGTLSTSTSVIVNSGMPTLNGIALDSSNNVYVVGITSTNYPLIVKYTSSLSYVSNIVLTSTSPGTFSAPYIDSSGNIYVISSSYVWKYNSSFVLQWASGINITSPSSTVQSPVLKSVAVDSSGNVFVAGYVTLFNSSVVIFTTLGLALQMPSTGGSLTIKANMANLNNYNSSSTIVSGNNYIYGVAIDVSGNTYWSGTIRTNNTNTYTPSGGKSSSTYNFQATFLIKDINSFAGTHASTSNFQFSGYSNAIAKWDSSYMTATASSTIVSSGSGTVTTGGTVPSTTSSTTVLQTNGYFQYVSATI